MLQAPYLYMYIDIVRNLSQFVAQIAAAGNQEE